MIVPPSGIKFDFATERFPMAADPGWGMGVPQAASG